MGIEYDIELLRSQLERAIDTATRIAAAPNPDEDTAWAQFWALIVKWLLTHLNQDLPPEWVEEKDR